MSDKKKKQTRRTVCLPTELFKRLDKAKGRNTPMSQIVSKLIEGGTPKQSNENAPTIEEPIPTLVSSSKPGKPGYIVNTDFVVEASSAEEAKAKVELLLKKYKLQGAILHAEEDD